MIELLENYSLCRQAFSQYYLAIQNLNLCISFWKKNNKKNVVKVIWFGQLHPLRYLYT